MSQNRQNNILTQIYNDEFMTYEKLASEFNVTTRTIRNDIKNINKDIERYECRILREGLYLRFNCEGDFNLKKYFSFSGEVFDKRWFNPENRVNYITLNFLINTDYIKQEFFIDKLFLSRSSLTNDYRLVRDLINKYDLSLISKPNYGQKISGKEENIRRLASDILDKLMQENMNLDIFSDDIINNEYYYIIRRILYDCTKHINISTSDVSFNKLNSQVLVSMKRANIGAEIDYFNLYEEYKVENELASCIVERINELTFCNLNEKERIFIIVNLLGINLNLDTSNDNQKLSKAVELVIENLYQLTGVTEASDYELKTYLVNHLKAAIFRNKNGIKLKNPILSNLRVNYPMAYELSVRAAKVINKIFEIELSDDEIGFISIHIGAAIEYLENTKKLRCLVVCTTGLGTSILLKNKILKFYGEQIKVIDTIQMYELDNYENNYDFIISTVPIYSKDDKDIIMISNILDDKEYKKIGSYLNSTNYENYIDYSNLHINKNFRTKDEVLKFLSENLVQRGLVDENIYQYVVEREVIASSYIGNKVAMPHPIKEVSNKTFWTILTNKYEIDWDGNPVRFVVLINVSRKDLGKLDSMYKHLISIIDNEKFIEGILNEQEKEQIYKLIMNNKII